MRHIILSDNWYFTDRPLPAFRLKLNRGYGWDYVFPVRDIEPVIQYSMFDSRGNILHIGHDMSEAQFPTEEHNFDNPLSKSRVCQVLQEPFRVMRTKKGELFAVPGQKQDYDNRCLLFAGCKGEYLDKALILESSTTCKVLEARYGLNDRSIEVISILEPGQSLAFKTRFFFRTQKVYLYTWNGDQLEGKVFCAEEWRKWPFKGAEVL
jgi:hypothetical protein